MNYFFNIKVTETHPTTNKIHLHVQKFIYTLKTRTFKRKREENMYEIQNSKRSFNKKRYNNITKL